MSRTAPSATGGERLKLARALGLVPLRLRGGRPPRPRLRIACAESGGLMAWSADPLAQQLLAVLKLSTADVSFADVADVPVLEVPPLSALRASAQARRALWPRLRTLRRQLEQAE
jgi:hypothetical protein